MNSKLKLDFTGQKFGKLTVIGFVEMDKNSHSKWLCRCDCGKEKIFIGDNLKRGMTVSCGCVRIKNIIGKKFHRLTVIKFIDTGVHNQARWLCSCECGIEKIIGSNALISNKTKSCGCFLVESTTKRSTKHGLSKTPEYIAWQAIKERCLNSDNPQYHNYGGRGINVCERWQGENGFENFYTDMGNRPTPKHSIDRYPNNDGDYEPSNCKWRTMPEQSRNKRTNIFIEYKGEKLVLTDWCKRLNAPFSTISNRLDLGQSFDLIYEYFIHKTSSRGEFNPLSKKIICNETGKIFHGICEAARQLNLSDGNIGAVLHGKRKRAGGFTFNYVD